MHRSMRIAIGLWVCLAITAQTSGLMLKVHLDSFAHSADCDDHDSEDCSICRHLCLPPKKFILNPPVEFAADTHIQPSETPDPIAPVQDQHPRLRQARAPPCSHL
ncbi:MAG: hypothetical protein FJ280_08415 [Planctomycetes bacterium]|nr:hypothetical protein [Planctomycetota bacterium]